MKHLPKALRSRWAVPLAAFLIQLSQYWSTWVTIDWWSHRATVTVIWFCFLWAATAALLALFLHKGIAFYMRCVLGSLVIAFIALTASVVIRFAPDEPWLRLGYDEWGYLIITYVICLLIGSIVRMIDREHGREEEIEQLRIENLSSRYQAIANQISPHFLFNSLSNLSSLIRSGKRTEALEYITDLSHVFRYVMCVKDSSLTTLGEELGFIESYHKLMRVRFSDCYACENRIPQQARDLYLPSLSLLPVVENIVKHNIIDSQHPMRIEFSVTDRNELVVSNPVNPKLVKPASDGIGLTNLSNRYKLLLGREVRTETGDAAVSRFRVFLPLVAMRLNPKK